ncbi:MAG: methionyl-tRNA formyltransferase [Ornithinimicrobium sp.]
MSGNEKVCGMRVLFAGTPEVAVPPLKALLDSGHDVVAVLTMPDVEAGRGRRVRPSPVAVAAADAGLETLKPTSLRSPDVHAHLEALHLDVAAVVAYGALVPPSLLALARHGWVNLHFSLLPAWRGAAPVQRAIMAGDDIIGATTFHLTQGLDTGPTLARVTESVRPADTAGDLLGRLSDAGAHLLVCTLDALAAGTAHPQPQPREGISHAPKLTSQDALIDWTRPAYGVDRQIRGCTPEPGAFTTIGDRRLQVLAAEPVPDSAALTDATPSRDGGPVAQRPGALTISKREVLVSTGSGLVRLLRVRPEGKQMMGAADWARGARVVSGDVIGRPAHG